MSNSNPLGNLWATSGNNLDNFGHNIEETFVDNIEDNSGNINTLLTPFTAMCFIQITLGAYV